MRMEATRRGQLNETLFHRCANVLTQNPQHKVLRMTIGAENDTMKQENLAETKGTQSVEVARLVKRFNLETTSGLVLL